MPNYENEDWISALMSNDQEVIRPQSLPEVICHDLQVVEDVGIKSNLDVFEQDLFLKRSLIAVLRRVLAQKGFLLFVQNPVNLFPRELIDLPYLWADNNIELGNNQHNFERARQRSLKVQQSLGEHHLLQNSQAIEVEQKQRLNELVF